MKGYSIKKIIQVTSVHDRYDTRIFHKIATSLTKVNNYDVHLIVSDGKGNEVVNNIHIHDVGLETGNRLLKMLKRAKKVYLKSLALNGDIYHLHDPELLFYALKLMKQKKVVIFDFHEDFPKQILSKPYLNPLLSKLISSVYSFFERYIARKLNYIIAATPYIKEKFLKLNSKTIDVNNFPILEEFTQNQMDEWKNKKDEVCYVGSISKIRGIKEIVQSMEHCDNITLNLAGKFTDQMLYEEVKSFSGWKNVNELGFLNRQEISNLYSQSKAGLVTLYPTMNYQDALPVKMFEYMIGGVPVIASNLPYWKEIIESEECGVVVDPKDPVAIAKAITYIISNPDIAEQMAQKGKNAVLNKYNWQIEEKKLFALYQSVNEKLNN